MNLEESLQPPLSTPVHDALAASVDVLGQNQQVTFTPYLRTVLPADGFVFWLRADIVGAARLTAAGLISAAPVTVDGSLHYESSGSQVEDETIVVRRVNFTAEEQITAFAEIAQDVLWVGEWSTPLGGFKFTFSSRGSYYVQANLHHYVGDAVYPVFEAQLIDTYDQLSDRQVVSNSMPIWLGLGAVPFPLEVVYVPPMFPAYLVPQNLTPPYIAVDINPSTTRALQAFARRSRHSSRTQLVSERVRFSAYGLRNDEVSDFVDYLTDYSELTGVFGVMNMPVITDDRRPQVELAAIAQRKMVEVEVSYNQHRTRDIARQLIARAAFGFTLEDFPLRLEPPPIVEAVPPVPITGFPPPPPVPPLPPAPPSNTLSIGGYTFYVTQDGGFSLRAPDGTVLPLFTVP